MNRITEHGDPLRYRLEQLQCLVSGRGDGYYEIGELHAALFAMGFIFDRDVIGFCRSVFRRTLRWKKFYRELLSQLQSVYEAQRKGKGQPKGGAS